MIHILRVIDVLTALKALENVSRCSVHAWFSSIGKRARMVSMLNGWLRFRLLFVKYFLMHMTTLSGFKPDFKYRLVTIG